MSLLLTVSVFYTSNVVDLEYVFVCSIAEYLQMVRRSRSQMFHLTISHISWENACVGLVYTARVSLPILERVHSLISNYCRENACFYIDNRNIRGFCLYKDGLLLLESGKKILDNNFIVNLNKFFLDTHTHHPPISL